MNPAISLELVMCIYTTTIDHGICDGRILPPLITIILVMMLLLSHTMYDINDNVSIAITIAINISDKKSSYHQKIIIIVAISHIHH